MNSDQLRLIGIVVILTILSGVGDAQGFIHASKIWNRDKVIVSEIGISAIGYALGIITYVFAVKFLQQLGIVSTEVQALAWFAVTIVGVALLSGRFFHWKILDQIVGLLVLAGIAWLLVRTGE